MQRRQIRSGLTLRVVKDRWETSPGTLAEVEHIGYIGTPRTWYFRVRWLTEVATRWGKISTNLFEEDLDDFEISPPNPKKKAGRKDQRNRN